MFSAFSDKNNPKKSERYSNNAGEQIKKTEIEKSGIHARNVTGMHEPGDSSFKKNFSQIFQEENNNESTKEKEILKGEPIFTEKDKISLVKKEIELKSFAEKNPKNKSFWKSFFFKKVTQKSKEKNFASKDEQIKKEPEIPKPNDFSKIVDSGDILNIPKQEVVLDEEIVKKPVESAEFEIEKQKENKPKDVFIEEAGKNKVKDETVSTKEEKLLKKNERHEKTEFYAISQKQEQEQETKVPLSEKNAPSAQDAVKEATDAPIRRSNKYDVDLLTKEYTGEFEQVNPYAFFGVCSALAVVAGVVVFLGSLAYEMKVKFSIEREKELNIVLGETIKTYDELENEDSVLSKKVEALSSLLENHISWKDFLEKLEKETIPEVSYLDMAASTSGSINISATAKDYTSLARQMTVFQKVDWIKKLDITGASYSKESESTDKGVSFDMAITVDKEIFAMKK